MCRPTRPACHEVPHATITTRFSVVQSPLVKLSPFKRAPPSATNNRPRSVFRTLSDCSKISFSMKWS